MKTIHPYIETKSELEVELLHRRSNRMEIIRAINDFVRNKFGINSFRSLIDQYGSMLTGEGSPVGFLARQIPFTNIEMVTSALFCDLVGLRLTPGSFVDDTFTSRSLDKRPAISPKFIKTVPSCLIPGRTKTQIKNISMTPYSIDELEGCVISDIPYQNSTISGFSNAFNDTSVVEHFAADIARVCGVSSQWDVSSFHRACMKASAKPPAYVFARNDRSYRNSESSMSAGDGRLPRVEKIPFGEINSMDFEQYAVRPPASWYYPLYFCLFMTGEAILLETYQNPRGEVAEAEKLFLETVEEIREAIGFGPMIIRILPLSKDMLDINADIDHLGYFDLLKHSAPFERLGLFNLYENIADMVKGYKGTTKWFAEQYNMAR